MILSKPAPCCTIARISAVFPGGAPAIANTPDSPATSTQSKAAFQVIATATPRLHSSRIHHTTWLTTYVTGMDAERIMPVKARLNSALNDSPFTGQQPKAVARGTQAVTPASYTHP